MRRIQSRKLPCLHCQPHGFIKMVHHLIERCILFRMGRDDCMRTLAKHANIDPIVTLTVWDGLLKENKMFFQAYSRSILPSNVLNGRPHQTDNVDRYGRTRTLWRP
ncbi:hypothetical protein L1887_36726 [Cichorium endivia]|nr:hypothetical protein L1887_36726 [Cichorium endivia]